MENFFKPRSVAVVGVSEAPHNLGRRIAQNLQEFSFNGIVYLVGPRGGTAFGRRIHKSVADIPDQVDLAVIMVPARHVATVLEECGQKGIRRAVIESAGFSEYGREGRLLENQLLEAAKKYHMRFIGPNCIGVINTQNGLAVPFPALKDVIQFGKISIISQSGGVGLDYLNVLASENLGLSKFASIGNKLNVDECDLLEYLIQDQDTEIICMYLESISNGMRLMELARKTSKPILLHKSNIGNLARQIAQSHTASLSGDDEVVSAALKQAGIARFQDEHTLLNFLKILPLPPMLGNRLAVLSRSGGHAVIAADACEKAGFLLTPFPERFLREIENHFRASVIRLTNPLDLGDLFDYEVYSRIVDETLRLPEVDGVVFLHTYISATEREASRALLKKLEEYSFSHGKPVATCVSTDGEEMSILRKTLPHPVFTAPEETISALALLRDFKHDAQPTPKLPEGALAKKSIQAKLTHGVKTNTGILLNQALEMISDSGIAIAPYRTVHNATEALEAAEEIGWPVALKLISEQAGHKTDVGGIHIGIGTAMKLQKAYTKLEEVNRQLGQTGGSRVLVQSMQKGGMELILGAKQDPSFGPVVLVGLGGIFVEVLKDFSMRVVPFEAEEADNMIRELKTYPLLSGARGQPHRDLEALQKAILTVASLIQAFPDMKELDINPLMVLPEGQGVVAVDARVIAAHESARALT